MKRTVEYTGEGMLTVALATTALRDFEFADVVPDDAVVTVSEKEGELVKPRAPFPTVPYFTPRSWTIRAEWYEETEVVT